MSKDEEIIQRYEQDFVNDELVADALYLGKFSGICSLLGIAALELASEINQTEDLAHSVAGVYTSGMGMLLLGGGGIAFATGMQKMKNYRQGLRQARAIEH